MTYLELINEFWRQDEIDPMSALDTKFYMYLLNECNKRRWINPFELQSRIIELKLMITRKTIGEVRNRLKQRGLIDFVSVKNRATVYWICNVDASEDNCLLNCFPQVTIEKLLGLQLVNYSGYNSETHTKTEDSKILQNNIYSPSRTCEERSIDRLDSLLQEIYDGKHQQWADQMRMKCHIDSVADYLPSFRDHAIACGSVDRLTDINEVKLYFLNSFRFFTKIRPLEQLSRYEQTAKSDKYQKFCKWLAETCGNVARGLVPLTEDEFEAIFSAYDSKLIFETIRNLNEREDCISKYFSLYRTLLKWIENERTDKTGRD